MVLNPILNAFSLLLLLVFVMAMAIFFSVQEPIRDQTLLILNQSGITVPAESISMPANLLNSTLAGIRFIMWVFISAIIISSFISTNSFREYLIGTIASIIATSVVTVMGSVLWNSFVAYGSTYLTFTTVSSLTNIIVDNWTILLLANLASALASFVWARGKQKEFLAEGYGYNM